VRHGRCLCGSHSSLCGSHVGPACAPARAMAAPQPRRDGILLREVLSPVSFGRCVLHRTPGPSIRPMPARRCVCPPSNAACCWSCAPARRHPGPCGCHDHHPSPGRPPASISTLLTRPSAVRASFLPFPCAPCAGLLRRFQRPLRLSGQLPGRQEQCWRWPQRGRRQGRRFGRLDGRWRPFVHRFCLFRVPRVQAS
jgi:hypothetical protein